MTAVVVCSCLTACMPSHGNAPHSGKTGQFTFDDFKPSVDYEQIFPAEVCIGRDGEYENKISGYRKIDEIHDLSF